MELSSSQVELYVKECEDKRRREAAEKRFADEYEEAARRWAARR